MAHPNQNNCLPCGNVTRCPSPRDFCLTNNQYDPNRPETGSAAFCSIECTDHDSCPNGYDCHGIVVPTQSECTNSDQCGQGSVCVLGEAALRGWCTCRNDEECTPSVIPATCQGSCGGFGVQACTDDSECITTCEFTCLSPAGQPCTDDAQCQTTPLCQAGTCVTNGQAAARSRSTACATSTASASTPAAPARRARSAP